MAACLRLHLSDQHSSTLVVLHLDRESAAFATSLPVEAVDDSKLLCPSECASNIEQMKMVNLPSGLQYREIKEGTGSVPPIGFQVMFCLHMNLHRAMLDSYDKHFSNRPPAAGCG